MKAKMCLCLCLLLPLFFAAFFTETARGDVITDRLKQCLLNHIADPYPSPSDPDPNIAMLGKAGYAMAALYCNQDITTANADVNYVCSFCPIPQTGTDFATAFELPILCRIYLDPNCGSHLCNAAKTNIANVMHAFVDYRSKCSDANASVWFIAGSENWDMTLKTSYMLGCQVLKNSASYGGSHVLQDNRTVDAHIGAWQAYFFEYFRQRAREGIHCEIASHTYAKYTMSDLYNVRDYTTSTDLQNTANTFFNLYWAEYASDLVSFNGCRGGAETRWYQCDLGETGDSLYDITYAYNWHDNAPNGIYPNELMIFLSNYRNPAWLDALAGNPYKNGGNPYTYTKRQWGWGNDNGDVNGNYKVNWADANNSSNLRRDTYWHKDYVMGALSLKTETTGNRNHYIKLINQNRTMGIIYDANGLKDRIIVDGNGTGHTSTAGYSELTGLCGKNCLIASRDPNAYNSTGTRIFLPNGNIFKKIESDSGWYFTQTGPYGCVGRKFIADVCSTCIRNELIDGNNTSTGWASTQDPTIVSGGQSGNCLNFNAANKQVAYATQGWLNYDSAKADFWFNAASTAAGTRMLVCAESTWEITVSNRNLTFLVYNNSTGTRALTINNAFQVNVWSHVIASVTAGANPSMNLSVTNSVGDNNTCTPRTDPNVLKVRSSSITLGNKTNTTRFFDGKLDTLVISVPSSGKCIGAWNMEASYVKDVYTAFRIANGSYTQRTDTDCDGYRWVLTDSFSPVVFEVNSANVTTYANFKTAVKTAGHWTWDSVNKKLTYKSCNGTTYVYWEQSSNLPQVGVGNNINLNPNATYAGPFVNGNHGMDTVAISDGIISPVTLDFGYATKSRLWDDYQTVALWHMDSITSNKVVDDDLENSTRNNDLNVYGSPNTNTSGPTSAFAKALSFNGTTNYGQAVTNWASHKTVKVDVWFNTSRTDANSQVIVAANNTWSLACTNGIVGITKWRSGGTDAINASSAVSTNTWYHCTVTIDAAGAMTLLITNLNGTTFYSNSIAGSGAMLQQSAVIQVGNKSGYGRWFKGYLDDIRIAKYSTP